MGGPGSGKWFRWHPKMIVGTQPFIDIRTLKQKGVLYPGARRQISWSKFDDESFASLRVEEDRLVISYEYVDADGNQQSNQDVIAFDFTPCHFGGHRTWLKCPECTRRVVAVHRVQSGFACRHCCNLTYRSQNDNYRIA